MTKIGLWHKQGFSLSLHRTLIASVQTTGCLLEGTQY